MLGNPWSSWDWQCFQLMDANSIPGLCALRQFLRALCEYTHKKMGSQGCISTIASFSSRASVSPSSSGTCTFFHSRSACSPASPECAGTAFHVTRQWIWFGNWARLKITQPGKKCFAEEKAAKLQFDSLSLLLGQWRERACDYERWSVQFGWCETWRI